MRLVAQKLGIPLPKASYSTPGEAKEARLRGQLLDVHERAVAFFQECLRRPEGARAREYLAGRGLDRGNDRDVPHRLRPRFRLPPPRPPERRIQRRSPARKRPVLLEARRPGVRPQTSGPQTNRAGAPSLSVRPLDGQGGDFDVAPNGRRAEGRRPNARRHVLQVPQPRHVPHRQRSRAKSSPSPDALSPPTKNPDRNI